MNTGRASGYRATYSMEAILQMVLYNLTCNTPGTDVTEGRIDFLREREFDRLDYSLAEGLSNFKRVAQKHSWLKTGAAEDDPTVGAGAGDTLGPSWDVLAETYASLGADAPTTFS